VGGESKCLKFGDTFRDAEFAPQMVLVPAGSFLYGSSAEEITELKKDNPNDAETFDREGPQTLIHIDKPFAIGRSHVTRGEFGTFVTATGYKVPRGCRMYNSGAWTYNGSADWRSPGFDQDDRHPVVCIDLEDAMAYVQWLSKTTGATYRLLSETEAEYAARGTREPSPQPSYFFGNEETDLCAYGNSADLTGKAAFPSWSDFDNCKDGSVFTAPIESYKPNAFGLYDVHGNVWTWTADCWSFSNAGVPTDGSPRTSGDCSRRAVRGGSWNLDPHDSRSASRYWNSVDFRGAHVGLRVARTVGQ
jgi:formylglycine-generating enzyme required for sulfatase activity